MSNSFVTLWSVGCQAPLSMGFSRQEYWSEKKKKNTGVGCHFLHQGILLTQGSNPHLLHWQVDSLLLSYNLELASWSWVAQVELI